MIAVSGAAPKKITAVMASKRRLVSVGYERRRCEIIRSTFAAPDSFGHTMHFAKLRSNGHFSSARRTAKRSDVPMPFSIRKVPRLGITQLRRTDHGSGGKTARRSLAPKIGTLLTISTFVTLGAKHVATSL